MLKTANHHVVQPRLTIGQPNDRYEKEADAIADQVIQMPQSPPPIQRKCEKCGEEALQMKPLAASISPVVQMEPIQEEEDMVQTKSDGGQMNASSTLSSQLSQSKGGGSSLPNTANEQMSSAFGTDFSGVRIHTDSKAIQMNQSLNARAFTNGNDIFFDQGQYNPESNSGRQLLAHELTHVVQQNTTSNAPQMIQADFWDSISRGWELYWNLNDEGAHFARQLMEHYAIGLGTDFDVFPRESNWNEFMLGRPEIQRAIRPLLERVAVRVASSGPTDQPGFRWGAGPSLDESLTGVMLNELESMRLTLHGCHRIDVRILYDVNAIEGGHEVIFRQIKMKWVDVGDLHSGTGTMLESGEIVADSEFTSAGNAYNIFIEFMPHEYSIYHVIGGSATQISGWPPSPGTPPPSRTRE